MTEINEALARKVLDTVNAGLVSGLGAPVPGKMCVEAAVCAMGLPHSDKPTCVGSAVRAFKIRLNDAKWSSVAKRTEGLRKLAIAQLGSEEIDQTKFVRIVAEQTIRQIIPRALRAAKKRAKPEHQVALEDAAIQCEQNGNKEAAFKAKNAADAAEAAYSAASAAAAASAADSASAARDEILMLACEICLYALVECKSPGCEFLFLVEDTKA